MGQKQVGISSLHTNQIYIMNTKVLLVFVATAMIVTDAGVLSREKRTLGLVKFGATKALIAANAAAAAIPNGVALPLALLGKYALYKQWKKNSSGRVQNAPAVVAGDTGYWYEPIPGADGQVTYVSGDFGDSVYEPSYAGAGW